jgi:hypothetical protein
MEELLDEGDDIRRGRGNGLSEFQTHFTVPGAIF